jgi:hypothetical protein
MGEKEGRACIKAVMVKAELWVETMLIDRATNQLEQWPMMVQTSEGQAPQMKKPNLEVAQDGKTNATMLHIQKDSNSVGEKRKEPQDHIITEAVDESGGSEGSKAKDKEKEK